jgi:hypothetical protein
MAYQRFNRQDGILSMKTDETEFHDPGLKAAVKRAWGAECCPAKLRNLIRNQADQDDQPIRLWLAWGAAVAAVLAMAITLSAIHHPVTPAGSDLALSTDSSSQNPEFASILPTALQTELIKTHDRCAQKPSHQRLLVSMNDDAAMAAAMRNQLSRAVLVARPSQGNWTFKGASVCQVASSPTGHLVFASGDQALSVFSLPNTLDPNLKDGAHVEMMKDGHPIAAFAKDGALFCLVSSGAKDTMTVQQLALMRDRMEGQVTTIAATDAPGPAIAELLYPVTP